MIELVTYRNNKIIFVFNLTQTSLLIFGIQLYNSMTNEVNT